MTSILRDAEHAALSHITLSGRVLDLGGSKTSAYQKLFQGSYTLTTINFDEKAKPDVRHNLEKPLPFTDASYNAVLLINVLEHIFHTRELLSESVRVLQSGGMLVIVVPFLFPVHPSPDDFWRFTESALARILEENGLRDIEITPLGSGVFAARALMLERLLPAPLVRLCALFRPLIIFTDHLWSAVARLLGKKYHAHDYPLGYVAIAKK